MKNFIRSLIALVVISVGLVLGTATGAIAHHGTTTGTAVCVDPTTGTWRADFVADASNDKEVWKIAESGWSGGEWISVGTNRTKSVTTTANSVTDGVSIRWANQVRNSNIYTDFVPGIHGFQGPYNATVNRPAHCNVPTTPPTKPPTETEWVDGTFVCGDVSVTQTRSVTKYTYAWNGNTWVESNTVEIQMNTRPLTADEIESCRPSKDPIIVTVDVGEPVCGLTTISTTTTTTTYTYEYVEGQWVETETVVVTDGVRDLGRDEQYTCPTEPPATIPPTTENPRTTETPVPTDPPVTASVPPFEPTSPAPQAPQDEVTVPSIATDIPPVVTEPTVSERAEGQTIPVTGSYTGTFMVLGGSLLGGGILIMVALRRRTIND